MMTHLLLLLLLLIAWSPMRAGDPAPIRVAVIGGIANGEAWPPLIRAFETESGLRVTMAVTGQRERCAEAIRKGEADLAVMHGGDIPNQLVADGAATALRPWARNEMVIFGPREDPAGIRGLKDGVAALQCIASTAAPYLEFRGVGSRELARSLWEKAGAAPRNVVKDDTAGGSDILHFAAARRAYVLVNRPAPESERLPGPELALLVAGDPAMRRDFIVLESTRTPAAGKAHRLADFLLSAAAQRIIRDTGAHSSFGVPLLFPLE